MHRAEPDKELGNRHGRNVTSCVGKRVDAITDEFVDELEEERCEDMK